MSSESPPTLETAECNKLLDTLLNNASTPKKKLKAVRNHCMALLMLLVVPVLGILLMIFCLYLFLAGSSGRFTPLWRP